MKQWLIKKIVDVVLTSQTARAYLSTIAPRPIVNSGAPSPPPPPPAPTGPPGPPPPASGPN